MAVQNYKTTVFNWNFTLYCGFSAGSEIKNSPANAGDTGFDPWARKFPYALEQLNPCITNTEPVR